jgi:hypothetical protein
MTSHSFQRKVVRYHNYLINSHKELNKVFKNFIFKPNVSFKMGNKFSISSKL